MAKPIILLVDDDKQLLDSLTLQIRQSSFGKQVAVETAQQLEEAWETLGALLNDNEKVGLIISDWLFPAEQRGNDFLMKVHKTHPGIPLVLLSGYVDDASVDQAFKEAGLKAFFRKPWDEDELMGGIKTLLTELSLL